MTSQPLETVHINISRRDGVYYISSEEVPGLWLWGRDLGQLMKTIGPAIQSLYKYNRGLDVSAEATFTAKLFTH